jgi:hypothetical protein
MEESKLLRRCQAGHKNNVKFRDFIKLIESMGFVYSHKRGSHEYYDHPKTVDPEEQLDLQNDKGEAKSYQIDQFLDLVKKYNLTLD